MRPTPPLTAPETRETSRPSGEPAGEPIALDFDWPGQGPAGEIDNFILGAWQPGGTLHVRFRDTPSSITWCAGDNWVLASATSPLHEGGAGLVHVAPDGSTAVGFRGYVFPDLHGYSEPERILRYWTSQRNEEHNGIFSAVVIDDSDISCTLTTDWCGFGPLYYRLLGRVVLFSTSPRYLRAQGDRPDMIAWRCFLENSWVHADRSLSEEIRRVPAGHMLRFSAAGLEARTWLPAERIPNGTRDVGPGAISNVEDAFRQAVDRCLGLRAGRVVLPLSSGFDSRRILTALHARDADFEAVSARVFNRGRRDLDARFATEMAHDFGFPHKVVEPSALQQFLQDDRARRLLVDSHTIDHTWAVGLMRALPTEPGVMLDGVAGDVLGDPVGWLAHARVSIEGRTSDEDVEVIASSAISDVFDDVLNLEGWPPPGDVRADLAGYLRQFAPRENLAELTFLLLRQRRAIALWSQQLLPPGHTVVYPYLDLDYARLMLTFTSTGKHATSFQRACLREYWPEFLAYPGTRDIPDWVEPAPAEFERRRIAGRERALRGEIGAAGAMPFLRSLLSMRKRAVLFLAGNSEAVANRASWYLLPLLELVARHATARPCWTVSGRTAGE